MCESAYNTERKEAGIENTLEFLNRCNYWRQFRIADVELTYANFREFLLKREDLISKKLRNLSTGSFFMLEYRQGCICIFGVICNIIWNNSSLC